MSHLRTHRILQLLVAATLLFGPAATVVKAACAIDMGAHEMADMPCSTQEAGDQAMAHEHRAEMDGPRCETAEQTLHVCCEPVDATAPAVLGASSSLRLSGPAAAAVIPGDVSVPDAPAFVPPAPSDGPPPSTSPVRLQALLATFLI